MKFDGVLTSPPYLNSFDYTDIYRPELLLLKEVSNSAELRKLRFSTIRSHVQVSWNPSPPLNNSVLQKKIQNIKKDTLWCGKIPEMINAYFVDLDMVICQIEKRLTHGATVAFVVADSAYNGVVVPVSIILSEMFEQRGFRKVNTKILRKTRGNGNHQQKSTQQLTEAIVFAEYHDRSFRVRRR